MLIVGKRMHMPCNENVGYVSRNMVSYQECIEALQLYVRIMGTISGHLKAISMQLQRI